MFHGLCGSTIWDVLGDSGVDSKLSSWSWHSWVLARPPVYAVRGLSRIVSSHGLMWTPRPSF